MPSWSSLSETFLERNEVELDGVRFPVLGPVLRIPVMPFAAKITVGDYTRDSELVASSWVQSSWLGGHGVENGKWPEHQDRFWYSTLDTRWARSLMLRPRLVLARSEAFRTMSVGGVRGLAARFGAFHVVSLGNALVFLKESFALEREETFPGPVTDLLVLGDQLFVAGPDFDLTAYRYTTSWEVTVHSGKRAHLLAELGGWLYALDRDGYLWSWDGLTWSETPVTKVSFPPEAAVWLFSYTGSDGEMTLYLVGPDGLYFLDKATSRFFLTNVTWPVGAGVQRGCLWRGEVFFPFKGTVLRWNGTTLTNLGPAQDEGLPPEYPRRVLAVYPSMGYLLACLGREPKDIQALFSGSEGLQGWSGLEPFESTTIELKLGPSLDVDLSLLLGSATLASIGGSAWHAVLAEPLPEMQPIGVSPAQGDDFLFLARGRDLYAVRLLGSTHNPAALPVQEVSREGTLLSPRFDAGWAEVDKVGLQVTLIVKRAAADLPLSLSYRTDRSPNWTPVGTVTAPGSTAFSLDGGSGFPVFSWIQFRIDLSSSSPNLTDTPVLDSLVFHYLRRPRQRFAYQTTLDFSRPWRGKSQRQLAEHLLNLASRPEPFRIKVPGDPAEKVVVVSRLQWAELVELSQGEGDPETPYGRAAVSFLEVI